LCLPIVKLLYFMYLYLLRTGIILGWVVGLFNLFTCLLRIVEIIMFVLSYMFVEN
jgi:hypothetical protein